MKIAIEIDNNRITIPDGCSVRQEGNTIFFEPKEEDGEVKRWKDLKAHGIKGRYIETDCSIEFAEIDKAEDKDRNIARTEAHCRAMLAMAMISQLKPYYGGDIVGEEWKVPSTLRATIYYSEDTKGFSVENWAVSRANPLVTFHTKGQAEEFIRHNEDLLRDYFMISKEEEQK